MIRSWREMFISKMFVSFDIYIYNCFNEKGKLTWLDFVVIKNICEVLFRSAEKCWQLSYILIVYFYSTSSWQNRVGYFDDNLLNSHMLKPTSIKLLCTIILSTPIELTALMMSLKSLNIYTYLICIKYIYLKI